MACHAFLFSSVFCALGGATTDLAHLYQRSAHVSLFDPVATALLDDYASFNDVVEALIGEAERDMKSEGYSPDSIEYSLQFDMRYGAQFYLTRVTSPRLSISSADDVAALIDACRAEYIRRYSEISVYEDSGIDIENFFVTARVPLPKPRLPELPSGTSDASSAVAGEREVYWPTLGRFVRTPISTASLLCAGNIVQGPALIEAEDTTILVPPDRVLTVNKLGGCVIEPKE